MKLLDSLKRIYTKYNCKQKHFLWFLSLSTPCMSHFHSNNQFPRISNLIPCIPTAIPQIPTLIPCISHIPKLIPPISPPPLFMAFSTWLSASLPHSPHSPHSVPQFPNPSLKTLATSWRSSHQSVSQRKQFFRIAFLQSIKLKGFLIFAKMSKKIFYISNLASLQPVILLEIELSHWCFSIILKVHCWIVLLHLF